MSEPPTAEKSIQECRHDPSHRPVTSPGRTLLPAPIASLVTTFTQTASFGLRVGTKVGGFAIAGARETTLTSLELTRAAVEAVLTRAGRDVSERRNDELGRAEAESILDRTVNPLSAVDDTSSNYGLRSHHYTPLYPLSPSLRPRASTCPQRSSLLPRRCQCKAFQPSILC